ncbi:TolC family protein [Cytophagaceae bacterium 50C-KIRBA]|uniref:TolC family protein n=1 Tax=Aquirufa beregesia TaxID=2516556 RepID=A0ABX0ETD8_9BACT|nr:TolC family protein [Aquirufa beregesia]NGZ43321.1 TolC family protein [Aquirufa beregesia]
MQKHHPLSSSSKGHILKIVFFFVLGFNVSAQIAERPLSLQKALEQAILQNKQLGVAQLDVDLAKSKFKQTEAIWLPQVNFSYTGLFSDNPLNSFGFKLQQGSVQAADFNPTLLNKPGGNQNYLSQLSIQQPIFNMDMHFMRLAAEKQIDVYQNQKQRTHEGIKMQVTQAYLQLELMYEARKVVEETLYAMKNMLQFTQDRFNQGLMQKSDLLNAEVHVKAVESKLAETSSQISAISDQLSFMMNQETGVNYTIEKVVLTPTITKGTADLANRSDIKAMKEAEESLSLMLKSNAQSSLPRLNGFANYMFNDYKALGFNANSYLLGFNLSWDIFKGNQIKNKNATLNLEKQKLQEQIKIQINQASVDITKTSQQIADALYKITLGNKAVEQAEEAYKIIRNRYTQGLSNTTDVLMAQTQLSEQKMLLSKAVFEQKMAEAYLNFLTESTK